MSLSEKLPDVKLLLSSMVFALSLSVSAVALAGPAMVILADDVTGLDSALDLATISAQASDNAVVLIVKDTQVTHTLRGSSHTQELRNGMARGITMFVCGADLTNYGLDKTKVVPGMKIAQEHRAEAEGAELAQEPLPLERFGKQASKACEQ